LRAEAAKGDTVRRRTDYGLFGGERDMSPNLPVDEGRDRAIEGTWELGSVLSGRQQLALRHRVAGGALGGDFAYSRFAATASARRFLVWNHEAILDLTYVRAGGRPPEQRLADLGGLGTVRGFLPRSRVGTESLRARLEVQVPYDVFKRARVPLLRKAGLQLVPWADAGRTWGGNAMDGDGSGTWLTSAGLGVQKLLGPFGEASFIRLDVAVPMGPERREDVRAYLYFARGLF
jgi:hemolysin activation/secretion protein